LRLVFTW